MVKNGTLASPAMARASSVLPVPGGPDQQHALGDLAAETLEFLRVLQKFDDFLQLALRLVDAGHILERDASLLFGQHAGTALAEPHGTAATGLHLAHEEHPDADQQQHREPAEQLTQQRAHAVIVGLGDHAHALVGQALEQIGIFRRVGLEIMAIGKLAGDGMTLDHSVAHVAAIHFADEIRVGHRADAMLARPWLEQVEEDHKQARL